MVARAGGRGRLTQRLLFLHRVGAVPQSKGSGSLSSALTLPGSVCPLASQVPGTWGGSGLLGKVWSLAGMRPRSALGSEASMGISSTEPEN